jgi:hypothetical protein
MKRSPQASFFLQWTDAAIPGDLATHRCILPFASAGEQIRAVAIDFQGQPEGGQITIPLKGIQHSSWSSSVSVALPWPRLVLS